MHTWVLLVVSFWIFIAGDANICMRVVGGTLTTIEQYPSVAAILFIKDLGPVQICGGTILNEKHILTAAHCFSLPTIVIKPNKYLIRVGSSMAHSGGNTHRVTHVILHPNWNRKTFDSDVAIMRTVTSIIYKTSVQPATLAESNYQLRDNESVWAVGWGLTSELGMASEQLRHVNIFVVNPNICKTSFRRFIRVTENMLCAGWLGIGGRDQCTRDSGSPVFHRNKVVGLSSMGVGCARPCLPGINVRVSRFSNWIRDSISFYKPIKAPPKSKLAPELIRIPFHITVSSTGHDLFAF